MKLVCLPQGLFAMGSPSDEFLRKDDERLHPVVISGGVFMGVHEVTQQDYQHVMKTNPSYFSATGEGAATVDGLDTKRLPVEQVTWAEANEFCRLLSALPEEQQAGRSYRLPTEAEWEFACRAGTVTAFVTGNVIDATAANVPGDRPYWNARKTPYLGCTRAAGSYRPNAFGLYDMHGNVAEWCQDWYSKSVPSSFETTLVVKTPEDILMLMEEFLGPGVTKAQAVSAQNPTGPKQGNARVNRGGSYSGDVNFCRSAGRRFQDPDFRHRTNGFRVVCTIEVKP